MPFDPKEYWNTRLENNYNLVGVGDISLSLNYNKWSYKVSRKVLSRLFQKYTGKSSNNKVLDVGSGTGFVVDIWKNLGKAVTGVDISSVAVQQLKSIFPNDIFVEANIGEDVLPVIDDSISCVSAASVLYHITEDKALEKALKNIYRVLQPDGIFIFSDNFIHEKTLSITHQKCRTLHDYTEALTRNGFEILGRVPNYVFMNDPVDSKSKFYPRVWSRLTSYSKKSRLLDKIIWPLLYPLELAMVSIKNESPAQEFMICRAVK